MRARDHLHAPPDRPDRCGDPNPAPARRARGALLAAALLLAAGGGCGDDPTGPSIGDLPDALTLRVGEERVLAPQVDPVYEYQWESSDPRVAAVAPSMGDCDFGRCRLGPGVTATVIARAPGQATVRVFAPGYGTGPRTGDTDSVFVTVQPAAP